MRVGVECADPEADRQPSPGFLDQARTFVAQRLPALEGARLVGPRACLYTNTPYDRFVIAWGLALVLLLSGCFALEDGPSGGVEMLRSEVEFVEDEGLEGSVSIDSLTWWPFLPQPGFGTTVEFEGAFVAVFRNVGEATVWVRYDLRFFDPEEFLIDAFIPIGQPVVLNAGETRRVEGDFLVRTDDPRDFERLALMKLVARIRWPDSLN